MCVKILNYKRFGTDGAIQLNQYGMTRVIDIRSLNTIFEVRSQGFVCGKIFIKIYQSLKWIFIPQEISIIPFFFITKISIIPSFIRKKKIEIDSCKFYFIIKIY